MYGFTVAEVGACHSTHVINQKSYIYVAWHSTVLKLKHRFTWFGSECVNIKFICGQEYSHSLFTNLTEQLFNLGEFPKPAKLVMANSEQENNKL